MRIVDFIKQTKVSIIKGVFELFLILSWLFFLCFKHMTLESLFICIFFQFLINCFYTLYLFIEQGNCTVFWWRIVYILTQIFLLLIVIVLFFYRQLNTKSVPMVCANGLYIAMFSSMILWMVNLVITIIDAPEKVNRAVTLGLLFCVIMGMLEYFLGSLSGNFIFPVIATIFGMKVISFGLAPKNARILGNISNRLYKYGSSKFRTNCCKAIDFLIFPTTLFRILCRCLTFYNHGFFVTNGRGEALLGWYDKHIFYETSTHHIPLRLQIGVQQKGVSFGTFILNINYFMKASGKGLLAFAKVIIISNCVVRVIISGLIIFLIGFIIFAVMLLANFVYNAAFNYIFKQR